MNKICTLILSCILLSSFFSTVAFATNTNIMAVDVVNMFAKEGLPVESIASVTKEKAVLEKLNAEKGYLSEAHFADSRIEQTDAEGDSLGGIVEVYATKEFCSKRRSALEKIMKEQPIIEEYMYQNENILVRIENRLTLAEAEQYKRVLATIGNGNVETNSIEDMSWRYDAFVSSIKNSFVGVMINNEFVSDLDTPAMKINGNTMVPLRGVLEKLGAEVKWDAVSKEIVITRDVQTIRMKLDSNVAYINNKEQKLDAPAISVGGRTMIPVRFVAESLDCKVFWFEIFQAVAIVENVEKEGNSPTISKSEFDRIKNDMSYYEVAKIIGSHGELAVETGSSLGKEYRTEIYTWKGEGQLGANANVTFQGGKVAIKAQAGLK